MSAEVVAMRLQRFLLALAGLICAGTVVELLLTEHMESLVQWIPFVLCGFGVLAVAAAWFKPQRATLLALRAVMILVAAGGLFGIYEHLEHNVAFELEIRPNATITAIFLDALKGANPLLAPGILTLAALLAFAATYYHPLLQGRGFGQRIS